MNNIFLLFLKLKLNTKEDTVNDRTHLYSLNQYKKIKGKNCEMPDSKG